MKYFTVAFLAFILFGCDQPPTADKIQQNMQETSLMEAVKRVGLPAIQNFRELKLLKLIYEKRDQEGLITYSYIFSQYKGKYVFVCDSIGYPMPAATQFTNPQKATWQGTNYGYATLPQADPNGLYSPSSADATWVVCKDPNSENTGVVYHEEKINAFPYKLPANMVLTE